MRNEANYAGEGMYERNPPTFPLCSFVGRPSDRSKCHVLPAAVVVIMCASTTL